MTGTLPYKHPRPFLAMGFRDGIQVPAMQPHDICFEPVCCTFPRGEWVVKSLHVWDGIPDCILEEIREDVLYAASDWLESVDLDSLLVEKARESVVSVHLSVGDGRISLDWSVTDGGDLIVRVQDSELKIPLGLRDFFSSEEADFLWDISEELVDDLVDIIYSSVLSVESSGEVVLERVTGRDLWRAFEDGVVKGIGKLVADGVLNGLMRFGFSCRTLGDPLSEEYSCSLSLPGGRSITVLVRSP